MSFSNYAENYCLNQLFTNHTVYVGYGTGGSDSSFTEITGNNYSRKAYGSWTLTSASADDQYVENDAAITFDAASGDQGSITHFALFDASSGGNLLAVTELPSAQSVLAGDALEIAAQVGKVRLE